MTAWDLNNPNVEITQELREDLDIPAGLETRDQIVEHYFQLSARIDAKNSAAYYNMGLFYLDARDCEKSKQSFRKHLSLIPDVEEVLLLLNVLEEEGCAGARLFLADMDEETRKQFLIDHPDFVAEFDGATSN